MIKEKYNKIIEKFNLKNKANIIPFLFTLAFLTLVIVDKYFFHNHALNIVLTIDFILMALFTLLLMFIIGFAVMKALVHISAGLSLIIFLAQSYCSVPNHPISGDSALKFLLMFGFIYLIFAFFQIFYKGISEYFEPFTKIKKEYIWKVLLVLVFVAIIFLFLWTIYQVVSPIVLNLCVYK